MKDSLSSIQILDREGGNFNWVSIERISQIDNQKKTRFIKANVGYSQIVQEDFPILTQSGLVPAAEVREEDMVNTVDSAFIFNLTKGNKAANRVKNKFTKSNIGFELTNELGWFTGIFLSDGGINSGSIDIIQNPEPQFEKLLAICKKYSINYTIGSGKAGKTFTTKTNPFTQWLKANFKEGYGEKKLPKEFIYYPNEFLDGLIAGMIDGDGGVEGYKSQYGIIRTSSEQLCHQLSFYLSSYVTDCFDKVPYNGSIDEFSTQKRPIYSFGFILTNTGYFSKIGSVKIDAVNREGHNVIFNNYNWVNIKENGDFIGNCSTLYKIKTESGHFLCNGILTNC